MAVHKGMISQLRSCIEATKLVQPSLRREGFSSVPDVTWDDVGGLDSLRKEFHRYIRCIKSPEDCDLLIELDGVGQRKGVYVIGATNRIDMIDDAILRPGRFGKKHYVPLPGARERVSILKALAQRTPVSSTVDLDVLALRDECSNLTGADLASLVDEAAMLAMEERWKFLDSGASGNPSYLIELSHFEKALSKVKPSVSKKLREHYEKLRKQYLSTT